MPCPVTMNGGASSGEITIAVNFVISYLYNKLPRRRVDTFAECLEEALTKKFTGHWYPEEPSRGSAYRLFRVSSGKQAADPVMAASVAASGLALQEVLAYMPDQLTLWIDPGEVSYGIGEGARPQVLYSAAASARSTLQHQVQQSIKFNPEAESFVPASFAATHIIDQHRTPHQPGRQQRSLGGATPSEQYPPSVAMQNPFLMRMHKREVMSAAQFAATKFGSTKLKGRHGRRERPNRLSPSQSASGSWRHRNGSLSPAANSISSPDSSGHSSSSSSHGSISPDGDRIAADFTLAPDLFRPLSVVSPVSSDYDRSLCASPLLSPEMVGGTEEERDLRLPLAQFEADFTPSKLAHPVPAYPSPTSPLEYAQFSRPLPSFYPNVSPDYNQQTPQPVGGEQQQQPGNRAIPLTADALGFGWDEPSYQQFCNSFQHLLMTN